MRWSGEGPDKAAHYITPKNYFLYNFQESSFFLYPFNKEMYHLYPILHEEDSGLPVIVTGIF